MRIVDLGSGESTTLRERYPEAEVVRVDLDPATKPDQVADIRNLSCFEDASFDLAHARHTLEHIPFNQTEATLAEWVRVLKPGGLLEVVVPDMGHAAELLLGGYMTVGLLGVFFGSHKDEYQVHKAGFTMPMLCGLMQDAGLKIKEARRDSYGVRITLPNNDSFTELFQQLRVVGEKS